MRIYISLPISNMDEKKQREKADRIKMFLSREGWQVVNPFDIIPNDKNPTWFDYIKQDLEELDKCDAIYLCEGWKDSCGCRIENEYAEFHNKKRCFECMEDSPYWNK